MRTISEIKSEMQSTFMENESLAKAYGYTVGTAFGDVFGSASIENLLLYVVSVSIYVLEALMNEHKEEVSQSIDALMVHRPKWYRDKALEFMKDVTLPNDNDKYDTTNMSESDISKSKVVKYAAATENADSSLLTIKVAGEVNGDLQPLDSETEKQINAYFAQIKDAGVRINLVNKAADLYSVTADIYYNALLTSSTVQENCEKAISSYIRNLPFNGEYSNMGLVDELQAVDGVKLVEFGSASVMVADETTPSTINARHRPSSGYMKVKTLTLNMKVYDE